MLLSFDTGRCPLDVHGDRSGGRENEQATTKPISWGWPSSSIRLRPEKIDACTGCPLSSDIHHLGEIVGVVEFWKELVRVDGVGATR